MISTEHLDQAGFVVIPHVIDASAVSELLIAIQAAQSDDAVLRRRDGTAYAMRQVASRVPAVAALARHPAVRGLVEPILGPAAFLARSLLFDKNPAANWNVAWHQDTTIAVRERRDAPGFGPWSMKAGVCHVQPPAAVLDGMITIRLHLDDCDETNGPLLTLPGSHRGGILADDDVARMAREAAPHVCVAPAGGAVVMRPLVVHSSRPATSPTHRRVIHFEFAASDLPHGLCWCSEA